MAHLAISPELLIPDLLRSYPQSRQVLDKYGLKGCGGENGPYETLRFFARAHEIEENTLLGELATAIASKTGSAFKQFSEVTLEDSIYRRFFLSAILVVLTFGATWGALLLWEIGVKHSFQSVSIDQVNAHAQAQVYGWMGLFIMGFAAQAFPRFWHASLWKPKLATANLVLMLIGIVLSSAGTTAGSWSWWGGIACLGTALELLAVSVFSLQIYMTHKISNHKTEPYILFIYSALVWFVLSTSFDLARQIFMALASDIGERRFFISVLQPALRDMQFHGLAICMILGVSLRTLPHFFDAPRPSARLSLVVLGLVNAAVATEVIIELSTNVAGQEALKQALILPHLALLIGSVLFAASFRLWVPFPEKDRSSKFIRTAYLWLILSFAMLCAMPSIGLSSNSAIHAYQGSVRHALTVGFVSLMIMGQAAKVVPTLNGIDPAKLSSLKIPFVLVNSGCFLRVVSQALTAVMPTSYAVIGLSGIMEVAGICIWSISILEILLDRRKGQRQSIDPVTASIPPEQISADMKVADVLEWFPYTEPIFIAHGFHMVTRQSMRNTVARTVSIRLACRMFEIDAEQFVSTLNKATSEKSTELTLQEE